MAAQYMPNRLQRTTFMRNASLASTCLHAFGRAAALLVLGLGLLSAANPAQAMGGGAHGGGFHGGGFHGGGFHGGGFHGGGFHGGFHGHDFDHHHFRHDHDFFLYGGCGWDPYCAGYNPYDPYDDYPPATADDPPPAGVPQSQTNCQSGQWREQDGSIVSGTACLQPDGSWRLAY